MAPTGGARVSPPLTFERSEFKCCSKKCNAVYCIFCGSVYHISCLTRDLPKSKKIDEKTIICCEDVNLTYKDMVFKVDKEIDISNLKLFVKMVIAENNKLVDTNNNLLKQISELNNNSCIMEIDTSLSHGSDDMNLWQERFLFTKKENDLLIEKNKLLTEKIDMLVQKINNKELDKKIINTLTYSKVCKEGVSITNNNKTADSNYLPPLIVKSKENSQISTDLIFNVIKEQLNPAVDNFVAKLTKTKNHVKIQCVKEDDCEKIKQLIDTRTENKFDIVKTTLKNPMIKIVNITNKYTNNELAEILKRQNNLIHTNTNVQVKYIKEINQNMVNIKKSKQNNQKEINQQSYAVRVQSKNKTNMHYTAFVELDPLSYNILMQVGKIRIGWDYCKIFEELNLNRCFKCNGYGHNSKKCRNQLSCAICADSHESNGCKCTNKVCVNCKRYNDKYGIKYNIDHAAYEYEKCEFFKNLRYKYRMQVNYNYEL